MKRIFIVHGWGASPNSNWIPWLKENLKNFEVKTPAMPNTDEPKINEWVSFLSEAVGDVDEDTYLVGQSIGCQTILRFLSSLDEGKKTGAVFLVAPWIHLLPAATESEEEKEIAKPWFSPISWEEVKKHCSRFVAIFSDNDPYVPLTDKDIFEKELDAKILVEHEKGHFSTEDGIKELPILLEEIRKIIS